MNIEQTYPYVSCASHTYRGHTVPSHLVRGLDAYVMHGQSVGSFLSAVLRNDLRDAVLLADSESLVGLPAIMSWLYQEAPAACWGSESAVQTWRAMNGLDGWGRGLTGWQRQ